ncbi:hypothetical protein SAMN05421823_101259 [Catalinimonas alkaloidigena]|uniref:Four helix bundle sensory module for signal transduction n=1 Tax=Catalinimonas alkaloidigena TaxID=1075417 RepID=A0A1G8X4H4_9BACT|nr:hypothetical protein [Catalinimonas alkaloidigena]SDJ85257.1 hypothetical protein SAMN05421823_101259 [Catalinimonas alkaloidigena]
MNRLPSFQNFLYGILLIAGFVGYGPAAYGQAFDPADELQIEQILARRDTLYQEYKQLNHRYASGGNRSHQELVGIAKTLIKIIREDNALIEIVQRRSKQAESAYVGQTRTRVFKEYELSQQIDGLESRLKQTHQELQQSAERYDRLQGNYQWAVNLVAVLGALAVGATFFAVRLWRRQRAANA